MNLKSFRDFIKSWFQWLKVGRWLAMICTNRVKFSEKINLDMRAVLIYWYSLLIYKITYIFLNEWKELNAILKQYNSNYGLLNALWQCILHYVKWSNLINSKMLSRFMFLTINNKNNNWNQVKLTTIKFKIGYKIIIIKTILYTKHIFNY